MKLAAVNCELVRRAVAIYQDLAYGTTGRPRRGVDVQGLEPESVLAVFAKEQVEPVPGYPCMRYSLRLGNRNYPFMKLLLQEHLVAGEFYFAVDTHDQMEIKPDFPDFEAWMAVKRFNKELKGKIEAQLAAEGLHTAASLRQLVASRPCPDGSPCRGTVLVVDDEEDLADAVALLFKRQGFLAFKVFDGRQALRAAADIGPDLVLLDYEMPEMDGLEVIAQLRADPITQSVPVLLTSAGKVSMADIRRADGFLAKPFQEALLFEMVQRVLRQPRGVAR